MTLNQVNAPAAIASPQGRRVLVAVVAGEAGNHIQRWREEYDPVQARRIPAHATLCYWAPEVHPAVLERQLDHAFPPGGLTTAFGPVQAFDGEERGLYVPLANTAGFDAVRARLYDGTYVPLGAAGGWRWHVTCLRHAGNGDLAALGAAANARLGGLPAWPVRDVAYLELRGQQYEPLATWRLRP